MPPAAAAVVYGGGVVIGGILAWKAGQDTLETFKNKSSPPPPLTPSEQQEEAGKGANKDLTRAPAAAAGACCEEDDPNKKKKKDNQQFSDKEQKVIDQAKNTKESPEFSKIREAQQANKPAEVNINGLKVQYEPNLPAEGMTMFGENGFVLGPRAFASEAELNKTLLHEVYRLNFSEAAGGVSGQLAAAETRAAASFAERAFGLLK